MKLPFHVTDLFPLIVQNFIPSHTYIHSIYVTHSRIKATDINNFCVRGFFVWLSLSPSLSLAHSNTHTRGTYFSIRSLVKICLLICSLAVSTFHRRTLFICPALYTRSNAIIYILYYVSSKIISYSFSFDPSQFRSYPRLLLLFPSVGLPHECMRCLGNACMCVSVRSPTLNLSRFT